MPTYEYKCDACDATVEYFQSMTAKPKKVCPECGKRSLVRQIGTGAALLFKGSGFYETDYRSESYKKAADAEKKSSEPTKSESKSESKSDSKSDKKSDKKPATKAESKSTGTSKPSAKSSS